MIKKIIAILLLSIAVILAMPYAQQGLEMLLSLHNWISEALTEVFTDGNYGSVTRQLIALLAVPFIVGLLPAIFYWVIKHSWFPYFAQCVWIVWLVQTSALIVMAKI